ncbi:DUF1015 domain-containing protein [Echinicola sediminis]
MAEILPFKAWRYNPELNHSIEELTSPLFDVVSQSQLKQLYHLPYNSIHLTVPQKGTSFEETLETLAEWKSKGIILQDKAPAIYVYYQYFMLPGSEKQYCRKGFIAHIKAYEWEEKVILRHEDTIARSVEDRIKLLKTTEIQTSPTHGLYEDGGFTLEPYMDAAICSPLYDIEDYQGVREVLAAITNPTIISKFVRHLKDKSIILADGHHRIQAAIEYRRERAKLQPHHQGNEGYNYHMMYLTNAKSNNLKIQPTHRLFRDLPLSKEQILEKLSAHFEIRPILDPDDIDQFTVQKKWSFAFIFDNTAYMVTLKDGKIDLFDQDIPPTVKNLDLSVLHYFFVEQILGIPLKRQRYADTIEYERNIHRCQHKVANGEFSLAVITREIRIEEVMQVCKSGHTLPQKSTYFYPKTLSGLLFGSIKEEEFTYPYHKFL